MNGKSTSHQDKRAEIVSRCAELFDRVGYHLASMQMIADAVELGKPTLYHYFKSKSEILYEMHKELMSELIVLQSQHATSDTEPDEALRLICLDTVRFIKRNPGYIKAFFEHFDALEDEHKLLIAEQRRSYLDKISSIIKRGIKAKVFVKRDPKISALAFLSLCNWTYQWMPSAKNQSVESIAETLSDIFLSGMKC